MRLHRCREATEGTVVEDMSDVWVRLVEIETLKYLCNSGRCRILVVDDDDVFSAARLVRCVSESGRKR